MKKVNALLWAVLPFCALSAQSQKVDSLAVSNNLLEEVVVTDSRFALKRSQSGKTIVKINSEEIQRFSGLGLGVLLSSHLGVDVIAKNMYSGQNTTVSIRGGRNRQVLILIDGVRVSDPSRIDSDFDINALNIEMIESIEIVKGAASSLYGSSAATGVINITTKIPKDSTTLIAKKTWGTEQSANQPLNNISAGNHSIFISGTEGGIGINLGYAERYSNGMSAVVGEETDPFNKVNLNVGLSGQLTSKVNWKLDWNRDEVNADFDNGFPLEQADYNYTTELDRFSLNTKYSYEGGSLNLNAGYQMNKRDFQYSSYLLSNESENLNIDVFNKYIFNNNFYTIVGFQYQKGTMKADYNPEVSQSDIYLNSVYLDPSGLNLNLGLRYNHHSSYDGHWIYSLNPSFSFDINTDYEMKILTSYSKAFIAPSLYQLYNPSYGNIGLKPENNLSFEFGTEIRSNQNALSAVYFNRKEDPTLIFGPSIEGYPYGRYSNSDQEIKYQGLELAYDFLLFESVKTRLNYIFTETTDGDLRSIPKHAIAGVMDLPLSESTHLNLLGQYTGGRFANDAVTELEAYSLFTLQLNHQLQKPNANVFLSVFNVFDTEYVIIPQYASRGRNILAGISIQLD